VLGSVGGALLLHATPVRVFDAIVPWLVFGATLLILFQRKVDGTRSSSPPDSSRTRRRALVAVACQLAVGVYGGFFGAAMGIVMLGFLSLVVTGDIHERNGLKNLLAVAINGVSSIYFLAAGLVNVRAALIMTAGAVTGGYVGGQLARRIPAHVVRGLVVAIGLGLSALLAYRALRSG
jgi:uncharacterized membrane protein YfcA